MDLVLAMAANKQLYLADVMNSSIKCIEIGPILQ